MEILNGKINSTNSYEDFKLEEMDRKKCKTQRRQHVRFKEHRLFKEDK